MDLRVIVVLGMYCVAAVYALRGGPFAALLVYMWLGYFRPDHWVGWSVFVRSIPMSYGIGMLLVATTILSPQVKLAPRGWAWVMLGFAVHVGVSLSLSPVDLSNYPWQWWGYRMFMQSIIVAVVMTLLVTDRQRYRLLVIVLAVALSAEAAKQGWVMLLAGSSETNINDIPFLGDNNHVAVGVLMMAAVLGSLMSVARRRPEKALFAFLLVGMVFRSLTTHSRGGFLALGALALTGLLYAQRRVVFAGAGTVIAVVLLSAMPASFWDRMNTIAPNAKGTIAQSEEENPDSSAQSRMHFWRIALHMAADRPVLGVGFLLYPAMYDRFDDSEGTYGSGRAVHSAWFGALADIGVVGFLWFSVILLGAIGSCWKVRRLARGHPELAELASYAAGLNAAFFTYIVGATFVTLTYSDLLWHMMTLSFILLRITKSELAALSVQTASPSVWPGQAVPRVPFSRPAAASATRPPVRVTI